MYRLHGPSSVDKHPNSLSWRGGRIRGVGGHTASADREQGGTYGVTQVAFSILHFAWSDHPQPRRWWHPHLEPSLCTFRNLPIVLRPDKLTMKINSHLSTIKIIKCVDFLHLINYIKVRCNLLLSYIQSHPASVCQFI
jgi:hypothetical protein